MSFNDPFEHQARVVARGDLTTKVRRIQTLVREQAKDRNWKARRALVNRLLLRSEQEVIASARLAFEHHTARTGVCSFAGDPRSILMWSHYANSHTGLCLQFERLRDPGVFLQCVSVEYSNDYPVINFYEDTKKQIVAAILRKSKSWSYEGEKRIVLPDHADTHMVFEPEALTGIILGCRSTPAVKACLRRLIDERVAAGLPAVRIWTARRSDSQYKIFVSASEKTQPTGPASE